MMCVCVVSSEEDMNVIMEKVYGCVIEWLEGEGEGFHCGVHKW